MALTLKGKEAKAEVTKVEETKEVKSQAKTKANAAVDANTPKYDESILGSKSDTITFIAPLGDPSRPDTVTVENPDGTTTKSSTPYIVGYELEANVDMEVPECGLGEVARKNLMSYANPNGKKQVKAGERFYLTRFELGVLLAPPEFNGRITGGGKGFTAVYQRKEVRSSKGTLGETTSATEIPTVSLKADSGSIKDYQIIEVLTYTSEKGEKGTVRKHRTIKAGFEKWEPLCIVQAPKSRTKGEASSTPKNRRNAGAEAFLQILAKKQ